MHRSPHVLLRLLAALGLTLGLPLLSVPWTAAAVRSAQSATQTMPPQHREAEAVRPSGEGVAYHDSTPGNQGDAPGMSDVDLAYCSDGEGCIALTELAPGDWTSYEIPLTTSGRYIVRLRVAVPHQRAFMRVSFSGGPIQGYVRMPLMLASTGSVDTWTTVESRPISLPAGVDTLYVVQVAAQPVLVNWIELVALDTAPTPSASPAPPSHTPTPSPSAAPTPPPAGPQPPLTCANGTVLIDTQDWWTNPDGGRGDDFGHIHARTCCPHKKRITTAFDLQVQTVMHMNPGVFRSVNVQVFSAGDGRAGCGDDDSIACKKFQRTIKDCTASGGTLTDNGMTCSWLDTLHIDPRLITHSGWQQFRLRALVDEPDNKIMMATSGLHAYVDNGRSRDDCYMDPDVLEARGWYSRDFDEHNPDPKYANAYIVDPPLKGDPVSGVWSPQMRLYRGTSESNHVTGYLVSVDTDFHRGVPGSVIKQGTTEFQGRVTIDTRTLRNGWHRLFLKTDAFDRTTGSTNSGVLSMWFEVSN